MPSTPETATSLLSALVFPSPMLLGKNSPVILLLIESTILLTTDVCGVPPPPPQVPARQAVLCHTSWVSCDSIQSDTDMELVQTPQIKDSPDGPPYPHFRSQMQAVGPQLTHNFSLTWLYIGESHNFLLGSHHLLEQFMALRETFP